MGKRLRVLLVDDDEDEYLLTQEMLSEGSFSSLGAEPTRFEVDWVANYDEALERIRRGGYDAYLVDYNLGGWDGLDLLREAKVRNCQEPFIVLTGHGSYALDVQAMQAGATDYLVKGEVTGPLLERTIRYAIERKRTEGEIRRHAVQAELLATLSQDFAAASLKYPEILTTIVTRVAEAVGDACVIRLISEDGNWLDPVAYHHPNPEVLGVLQEFLISVRQSIDYGPAGRAFLSNQGVMISNQMEAPREQLGPYSEYPWPKSAPWYSLIAVPLRVHGSTIGTLGALRFRPVPVHEADEVTFFQDLADRAALAIDNARLYAAEAQRARELVGLQRATAALLSTIDMETLLSQILDAALSAIPAAEKGMLHLIAPETGRLQVRATTGFHDPRIRKVVLSRSEDFSAQAVRERKPLLIHDLLTMRGSWGSRDTAARDIIRSAVIAPLVLGEEVLGVISLNASQPGAFSEADKRLLVSFATTTTAALQNAMLHAEVQKLALTDSLTDVFNRRGFFELAGREVERAHRFNRPLSAIMIDLDDFKEINDTYGHSVGDQALRVVAQRLRSSLREVDIIGRYGGDEFVVLLPETDLFTACAVGERILTQLSEPVNLVHPEAGSVALTCTASMGVANVVTKSQDLNSLLQRADTAAYNAKRNGKHRVEVG